MASNDLFTFVQLYNANGTSVTEIEYQNWYGGIGPVPYRLTIPNGEWGSIIHVKSASQPGSSSGGVQYRFQKANNGPKFDWIVAWDNTLSRIENRVFTIIREPSTVQWHLIQEELKKSTTESSSSYGGYLAHASIGHGNFPVLQAALLENTNNA